ncbi:hypothetical protein [Phenylobacterium sp.]|uniref:hypothetical protein n=1 Tax=Phenylobacterium sp. TaxID=1871053 RepID=UPI002BD0AB9A|nr:hypothetical protein [Phenylobacterium sp.]HVI32577.1 hypothetical protein [Phenylobacterium sp.]
MRASRLALALAATALTALAAVPTLAAAQDRPAAPGYKAPRNAWGQPDLQGVWTNATITPLERPAEFSSLVIPDAQARAMEQANASQNAEGLKPTDPNAKVTDLPVDCGRGFRGTDCGYNSFWVDPGTRLIRIGGEARSSIIVDPPTGKLPALTPEARQRLAQRFGRNNPRAFDGPESRSLGERCILSFGTSAGPPMLPLLYNNTYQIVQNKDEIAILVEMVHDVRIIRLNAKPLPSSVRQWMGDSIGRWEGDTLVVETTNMRPEQGLRGASGGTLKVVERFTRVSPTQILYRFTVEDPATYVAPFTGEVAMNATKGPIYEYACHEGNYALEGILAGARALEKEGRTPTSDPVADLQGEGGL